MGKKRISQLLDQLQTNYQADLQNAAAIFTVAQMAVNQLEAQHSQDDNQDGKPVSALLPARRLSKDELKQRYGSFNGCRAAASKQGIRFKKTPSWEQLAAAFAYFEALQTLIRTYLSEHPNSNLHGLAMEFSID